MISDGANLSNEIHINLDCFTVLEISSLDNRISLTLPTFTETKEHKLNDSLGFLRKMRRRAVFAFLTR